MRILSWLRLQLNWVDVSKLGGAAYTHKLFTCVARVEGEVPFLSPGLTNMQLPVTSSGPLLRPLLRWSWRGQVHGRQLRYGAANGLAQLGWKKPEKDTGFSPIGYAIPHLPLPSPLLILFSGGTWLVWPGQSDCGCTKGLIVLAKQITSEQSLVEVVQANSDIYHIQLQSGCQQRGHAGHTHNLTRYTVGALDVLGHLLLYG